MEQVCQRQIDKTAPVGGEIETDVGQVDQQSREMLFEEDHSSTYSLVNEADLRTSSERSGLARRSGKIGAATVERPRGTSNPFDDHHRSSEPQPHSSAIKTVRNNSRAPGLLLNLTATNHDNDPLIGDADRQEPEWQAQSSSRGSYDQIEMT